MLDRRFIPNKDIKNYTILNYINHGSYSRVYRAKNILTGQICALKHYIYDRTEYDTIPYFIIREISIIKNLTHPYILAINEIITEKPDRIYTISDYCDACLTDFIDRGNEDEPRLKLYYEKCFIYARQILEAIAYIHSKGIIHRDLKPGNILLSKDNIKLIDFNLSRREMFFSGKYSSSVVTLPYRAPEVLLNKNTYNNKIDIWSYGCILYILYNRYPLFRCTKESDLINSIFDFNHEGHSNISKRLMYRIESTVKPNSHFEDLLKNILVLDPDTRPSATDLLKHPFFTQDITKLPVHDFKLSKETKDSYKDRDRYHNIRLTWDFLHSEKNHETFFLAIKIADAFLDANKKYIPIHVYACASFIAMKQDCTALYETSAYLKFGTIGLTEFIELEHDILDYFNYDTIIPTVGTFISIYAKQYEFSNTTYETCIKIGKEAVFYDDITTRFLPSTIALAIIALNTPSLSIEINEECKDLLIDNKCI